MNQYFVSKKPLPNGELELHMEHCQYIPNRSNRQYIGYFVSCFDAMDSALKTHEKMNGCPFCCKEVHHQEEIDSVSSIEN